MSERVYRIIALLQQILKGVPVGTNLGLLHLFFALLSGRFLPSRGALFPALSEIGLGDAAVRRASAALRDGRFDTAELLGSWKQVVEQEGHFQAHEYDGICPVACDLVGFFRPHLVGCARKHYTSRAAKALPAQVFGMVGAVGCVGTSRLALPRLLVETRFPGQTDADLQRGVVREAAGTLSEKETLVLDAGFSLPDLLLCGVERFVLRGARNFTARKNTLPVYKGIGHPPEYGDYVRPLERTYRGKTIGATPPDKKVRWKEGRHTIRALLFDNLVLSTQKPGSPTFRCVVILDPRYKEPLILITNLPASVSAYALWRLYRDRWPIEQLPLAAKQMLGCERMFVFGQESRSRLPQLALLAGNVLSYVAATSPPVATGFWDRCARATCGRLRRVLGRLNFSDLPFREGHVREKASVTAHLPKGVKAHRRHKAGFEPLAAP